MDQSPTHPEQSSQPEPGSHNQGFVTHEFVAPAADNQAAPNAFAAPAAPVVSPPVHETETTWTPPANSWTPPVDETTQVSQPLQPQPVVQVLSPRGVEYVFLTISLFVGAISLISALIALVNGKMDFGVLAVPTASLVVSVPIFALLFLRLKHAELSDAGLALDASKRRSTQFTQIVAFVACLFALISFVSIIFAKIGGQYNGSIVKAILDIVCVVAVAGGVLFYYWRDEHKSGR